jgi:Histidinol-phosphate/aromatic aminotransferase and cobyric acid decarboxylase
MMSVMPHLVRPEIADLEAYTPIVPLEVLAARLGLPVEQIVKLDANENPYGPAPAALAALQTTTTYHIYPDPEQTALRTARLRIRGAHPMKLSVAPAPMN